MTQKLKQIIDFTREAMGDQAAIQVLTCLAAEAADSEQERERAAQSSPVVTVTEKALILSDLVHADVRTLRERLATGKDVWLQHRRTGERVRAIGIEGNDVIFDREVEGVRGMPPSNRRSRTIVAKHWGVVS